MMRAVRVAGALAALASGTAAQQVMPNGMPCGCDSCVHKDNSVDDCEGFGLDCGCFQGLGCVDCVRKGNTVATCESFGLPCDTSGGGGGGYGPDACGDIEARSAAVNAECCDEPTEDCSLGGPSTCNLGCARVLLPFFADCAPELGDSFNQFLAVVALCRAVDPVDPSGPPPPTPSPSPTPPPPQVMPSPVFEVTSGACMVSPGGECWRTPNYPNNYPATSTCAIAVSGSGGVRATAFDTESSYDSVTIAGNKFSGTGVNDLTTGVAVLDGSTISWRSDSSNQRSGVEVCGTALSCGDHGTSNAEGTACTCDANYFGRAVPDLGKSVCDEGPFPEQYEVSGCMDTTNCGVYTRVEAQCSGGNCDTANPSTCGFAPLYEKDAGLLPVSPTPGGNRVLFRWVLHDGSSEWRVGRGALLDCIGIPTARTSSHTGDPGMAGE